MRDMIQQNSNTLFLLLIIYCWHREYRMSPKIPKFPGSRESEREGFVDLRLPPDDSRLAEFAPALRLSGLRLTPYALTVNEFPLTSNDSSLTNLQ